MTAENKIWFVRLDPENWRVETMPWGVWAGGFRDSVHYNKHEAERRAFELNFMEENRYWDLSDEEKKEILDCLDTVGDSDLD